jgi:hypothetical protein
MKPPDSPASPLARSPVDALADYAVRFHAALGSRSRRGSCPGGASSAGSGSPAGTRHELEAWDSQREGTLATNFKISITTRSACAWPSTSDLCVEFGISIGPTPCPDFAAIDAK